MIKVFESDVLRYLGCHQAPADENILAHIRQLRAALAHAATPKSIYQLWPCQTGQHTVVFGGITLYSKHLARHLNACTCVAAFAVTLGAEADTFIRRYSISDMGKAVLADAVCTAMTENLCDHAVSQIAQDPAVYGWHPTARFSPGFGDFGMAHQRDILTLLDGQKRIGLTLTDSHMLCPAKSVTAVVGFRRDT